MQANEGAEEGRRERERCRGFHVAKFETKGEENNLVRREWNKEEKQTSSRRGKAKAKGREKAETKEVKIVYMLTEPL